MIIYNVTVNIEDSAHDAWLLWMKETHINDVMNTGMFLENKICKVMVEEQSGTTYSIQYTCKNMETLEHYQKNFAPALQADHNKKFEGKFVAFRTLLEIVHQH